MKKNLFFLSILFLSCSDNTVRREPAEVDSVTLPSDSLAQNTTNKSAFPADSGMFSIRLNDTLTLSLLQWDSTIHIKDQLGKPVKEKTRKLDAHSDTFSGSYIRDSEYKGVKIQFFSPPQNGRTFWIQEIILTNNKYETTRGVTIGDGFEKTKKAYPGLKKFPGENENMYYVAGQSDEKSIEMEFEGGKLKKLRMYYLMN